MFEPVTGTVKQTDQEANGVVKNSTKAIELNGEETSKAVNENECLTKYATNFDLRLIESLSEVNTSKSTSNFRLRVNSISKRFRIN